MRPVPLELLAKDRQQLMEMQSGGVQMTARKWRRIRTLLLARNVVIETNVIGERLVLAHRDVVPALWALRTRFRSELTPDAARAFELIAAKVGVNAGGTCGGSGASGARSGRIAPTWRSLS